MFLQARNNFVPAHLYHAAKSDLDLNLIELLKNQALAQVDVTEKQVASLSLNEEQPAQAEMAEAKSVSNDRIDVEEVHVAVAPEVPASPVKSPQKVPSQDSPAPSPAKSPLPEKVEVVEQRELQEVLEEEDELLDAIASPAKAQESQAAPSPKKEESQPVSHEAPAEEPEEEEEEDDLDLDDLNNDEKDILENDDNDGFESGEDW